MSNAFLRALQFADQEARSFDYEQRQYLQADDHQEEWRRLMYNYRRVDSPYPTVRTEMQPTPMQQQPTPTPTTPAAPTAPAPWRHPDPMVQLCQDHGGKPVLAGGCFFWPDGSRAGADMGCFSPPPADPRDLLRRLRRYHSAILANAEQDHHNIDYASKGYIAPVKWREDRWGHGPATAGEALAYLSSVIDYHRAALANISAQLAPIDRIVA